MADIGNLADASSLQDSVDLGNDIVLAQLFEVVGEEGLLILVWVNFGVFPGVAISSVVAEPHVVAQAREDEGRGLLHSVLDPSIG